MLKQESDVFVWHLHKDGIFSINYMYKLLVSNGINVLWIIWCLNIPLKIKNLHVVLSKKNRVILTVSQKVILSKRTWNSDTTHNLLFWATNHLIHIFFECTCARLLKREVYMVLCLNPPLNIQNCFNDWYPTRILFYGHDVCDLLIYLANKRRSCQNLTTLLTKISVVCHFQSNALAWMLQKEPMLQAFRKLENAAMYFSRYLYQEDLVA